jgi:hypothetical protein
MELYLSDALRETMDLRGIKEAFVRQVISHAESTSEKLMDMDTGRFVAHLRIGSITCWAEYMPEGGGYRAFNAYMHRMEIEEGADGGDQ